MRKFSKTFSVAAFALALTLAGCSASGSTASSGTAGTSSQTGTSSTSSAQMVTAASISEDTHYDADDLTWDAAKEVAVTLKDGGSAAAGSAAGVKVDGDTVTITAAGTYRLSGALSDGKVVIAAGEEDVVRVILDGVTLASSTGSPFVVQSANEAILFLEDGSTNSIKDAATYADQGTDAPNAALYSMADLTLAGTGSLEVNGQYNDGIVSKDGLVLASGNVTVKAADDGIRGKDYAVLLDGTYQITAGGDGFKSDNDTDDGRGWLLVNGGKLTVSAGDDGVKAQNQLAIANGTVTVSESSEGLEAQHIAISGGTVSVTASDDGVNASGGASTATQSGGGMGGGPGGGRIGGRLLRGHLRRLPHHQFRGRRPGLQRQRLHLRRHGGGQRARKQRQRCTGRQRRAGSQRRNRGGGRKRRHGGHPGNELHPVGCAGHSGLHRAGGHHRAAGRRRWQARGHVCDHQIHRLARLFLVGHRSRQAVHGIHRRHGKGGVRTGRGLPRRRHGARHGHGRRIHPGTRSRRKVTGAR
jgi:hypothetical protein